MNLGQARCIICERDAKERCPKCRSIPFCTPECASVGQEQHRADCHRSRRESRERLEKSKCGTILLAIARTFRKCNVSKYSIQARCLCVFVGGLVLISFLRDDLSRLTRIIPDTPPQVMPVGIPKHDRPSSVGPSEVHVNARKRSSSMTSTLTTTYISATGMDVDNAIPMSFVPIVQTAPTPANRRKPLLWVHVHKVAGHFMCIMAALQAERVVQPSDNCNWRNHDGYLDSGFLERGVSCEERYAYFQKNGFTYGQIERELWPSDLCWRHFDYGIMLREPLDLINSEVKYRSYHVKGASKSQRLSELRLRLSSASQVVDERGQTPGWKFLDNIQTRLLANAIDVPAGQIGKAHVDAAQELLSNFKVVARLSDLSNKRFKHAIFEKLGWLPDLMLPPGTKVNKLPVTMVGYDKNEMHFLREVNQPDLLLYRTLSRSYDYENSRPLFGTR